jgi:lambda repressor-like predicted transcriptional regulator
MARWRSAEEIEPLLERYRASGTTQVAYSEQAGISLRTLARYLRRHGVRNQRLIRVKMEAAPGADGGFVLVLANGRRIESGWRFGDVELARLIRVAEAV